MKPRTDPDFTALVNALEWDLAREATLVVGPVAAHTVVLAALTSVAAEWDLIDGEETSVVARRFLHAECARHIRREALRERARRWGPGSGGCGELARPRRRLRLRRDSSSTPSRHANAHSSCWPISRDKPRLRWP